MERVFRFALTAVEWAVHSAICSMVKVAPRTWAKFIAMYYPDARVRKLYWAKFGVSMGDGAYANPGLTVVNVVGDAPDVIIGNNVSIAPNVVLITHSSPNNSIFLQQNQYVADRLIRHATITISDDAWLGAGVIVLPGVKIGRGAIVGAGAVVLEDVPPMTVVAGIPARVLRVLN